ncbi:MAG: hypothetical protein B7Y37_12460 [Sphingobacteriia bacterium 28-36-52]|nr:MAG: hypothetical protein B7Y37_12460 [Sphingobacteriia bacterium 28-36-52]
MKWRELTSSSIFFAYFLLLIGQFLYWLGRIFSIHNIKWFILKVIIYAYLILWLYNYIKTWLGTLKQFG